MVIGPDASREMRREEAEEVDALLRAAFGGEEEVKLIHALRRDGDMVSEMVKPWQGRIAGYAALSRMQSPAGWLCLAPVAVLPEFQRGVLAPAGQSKGPWQVGRRLVSEIGVAVSDPGLTAIPAVVVLGQPEFYEKCEFYRRKAINLKTPYLLEYTMLAAPGEAAPVAELRYPAAFGAVDGG